MKELFADLHVHIGRSENGKPIKITAARSLNFANIAKECADRKGIQMVGIIDCASPYVIEDIETFLKNGDAYEIEDGGIIYKDKVCIILGSEVETSEVNEDGKTGSAHNLCYFPTLKDIKEFSDNKKINGVWITTQLVEASLDIDFDYLYTEMSTLDSLFQRLGRCYRKRELKEKEPNVYIFTKENSGIGSVCDKEIYEISKELLEDYNGKILKEEQKMKLVDELYSKEKLRNSDFLNKFELGMKVLDNIVDYNVNKKEAQQLLRKIESYTVIPKSIYDENIELFEKYKKEKNREEKRNLKREVNMLTVNISSGQMWKLHEYIISSMQIDGMKIIDLKYDNNMGLLLENDKDYDYDSRFL